MTETKSVSATGGGFSRRRMLQTVATAGVVLPLVPTPSGGDVIAAQGPRLPPFKLPTPVFSLAERNRRRASAREHGQAAVEPRRHHHRG